MLYRENGQFKASYRADQQIFPIAQDRVVVLLFMAFAFVGVPLLASEYLFKAILIPFLILALAAIGLNLLVGYCGQISLGSGAFMAPTIGAPRSARQPVSCARIAAGCRDRRGPVDILRGWMPARCWSAPAPSPRWTTPPRSSPTAACSYAAR